MCIAIASPRGVRPPNEEIFRNCWESNPDGAGFAFAYDGVVFIKKGFMTFDAFLASFNECNKRYNLEECGCLIHFRIATHGGVNQAMTHPFPIVADNGALSKIEYVSDYAVIHNGTISLTSSDAYREKNMSDTAIFVRDYLTLIAQNRQWFKRESNIELIHKLINSKMAILNGRGEIIHTEGFTEDGGNFYSNGTYKTIRVRTSKAPHYYNYSPYNYDNYDEYEDYTGWRDYNYGKYNDYSANSGTSCTSYQLGTKQTKLNTTIPMMRCIVGDTIEGDSLTDVCSSWKERNYALSKEGFLYLLIPPDSSKNGEYCSDYQYSLEFVGIGAFFGSSTVEREFHPNFYVYKDQFMNDSDPEALLAEELPKTSEAPTKKNETSEEKNETKTEEKVKETENTTVEPY
jgi:predicted glutamine amidotransferase